MSYGLSFRCYHAKACARTPRGEIAWGEHTGLYEWRGGTLIFYSGGDRQASDRNGRWTTSSSGMHRQAQRLGFLAALSPDRLN